MARKNQGGIFGALEHGHGGGFSARRKKSQYQGLFRGMDDQPTYDGVDDDPVYVGEDATGPVGPAVMNDSTAQNRATAVTGLLGVAGLIGGALLGKRWKAHPVVGGVAGALVGSGIGTNVGVLVTGKKLLG